MLQIANLEEIQGMLSSIPNLVDLQEQRDPNFVQDVKQWFSKLEKVLSNNRMAVAGIVATLRGVLISAERGIIPTGVEFHDRATRRKIREGAAAYLVRQTGDLVSSAIQKDCERVAEAERLTRQLVSMAKAKGLIKELPGRNNFGDTLKIIWRKMSVDANLSPGTVNVEGLIGPYDALIVLDRIMTTDTPSIHAEESASIIGRGDGTCEPSES